jgi:Uncharacterized protein conserved in bacteria (DUF2252)
MMDGLQYYGRQFRNMKGTIPIEAMDAAALADYPGVVGQLLAKGHARTSGASMISGYISNRGDTALYTFAQRYPDQTEADLAELIAGVDRGMLPVERGSNHPLARCSDHALVRLDFHLIGAFLRPHLSTNR